MIVVGLFHRDVDGIARLISSRSTSALWPQLIRHGSPSLILNIGSLAERGAPYASIYAGAKAYNMAWSRSLRMEAFREKQDVEVLGILVGEVTGVTHRKVKPNWTTPSARRMAEAALARVGCGRDVVVGYFPHALQLVLLPCVPDPIVVRVANYLDKDL
jgi:17beta-estradiol 17-dehydrogenase / very-long-chain 3-oxoacyl-CoA reductase